MFNVQTPFLGKTAIEPRLKQHHPWWWRASGYLAAIVPFLFLVASLWLRPDLHQQPVPDWQPVLARAEESWKKAELYEARQLYVRSAQLASWRDDWQGLLAAACGMKKLDNSVGSFFNTHTILVRAMMAAESRRSRAGISAVAQAFSVIGEEAAASMVLARVGTDWPEEAESSPGVPAACWDRARGDD